MESHFALAAWIYAVLMAAMLGYWAAYGGRFGRWIGAGLLVVWVLWVGKLVILANWPEWLYTPEERVFVARLEAAIAAGKSYVGLAEILPFGEGEVCYVTIGEEGLSDYENARLKEAMGQEVVFDTGSHVLDSISVDYVEPFFVVKQRDGVLVVRDLSGVFATYEFDKDINKYKGLGYGFVIKIDGHIMNSDYLFFCGLRERIGMEIKRF